MKRKALFVGVNEYKDAQIRNLNCSLRDANSLHDIFEEMGYETDILENPGRCAVQEAVDRMTSDMKPGDFFLFYFAGHGWTTTSGKHLLFCSDDIYSHLRYDQAGIPYEALRGMTEDGGYSRAFILDACRTDFLTGARGGDATTRDLRPIGEYVRDASRSSALAVLRSCSQYQHAFEIEKRRHGLFTLAMLEVIRNARDLGTELLFGEQFCDSVTARMAEIVRKSGLCWTQTPEFTKSGAAQVLVPGRRVKPPDPVPVPDDPAPDPGPPPLPDDEMRAISKTIDVYRTLLAQSARKCQNTDPELAKWMRGRQERLRDLTKDIDAVNHASLERFFNDIASCRGRKSAEDFFAATDRLVELEAGMPKKGGRVWRAITVSLGM